MATPSERVRTAWGQGGGPALNRVVELLAAEGHSRPVLEGALESLLLELRSSGADDETEEKINGVWDRLTGWCHRDGQIETAAKRE